MLSKLKNLFIMLIKHNTMRWHKPTDYYKILTFRIPTKIMDRPFKSINFINFFILIIKNIQSILTIV